MYALPILPQMTEVQEQRLEYLTSNEGINRAGLNCRERTAMIFLEQTLRNIRLATDDIDSVADDEYARLAFVYYEAYLYYIK